MSSDADRVAPAGASSLDADMSALSFWALTPRQRDEVFAALRRDNPVSWQRPPEGGLVSATKGYWAVVRHSDIRYVSRHPELFSSSQGINFDDVPAEIAQRAAGFIMMDPPRHTKFRGLVTQAFTPRQVRKIDAQIAAQAHEIVSDAVAAREVDVVSDVSMRLPLWTISEMLGVAPEDRAEMFRASNVIVGTSDEEFVPEGENPLTAFLGAVDTLHAIAHRMQEERRVTPRDDLTTTLMQAEVDGDSLTPDEIGSVFSLLAGAGNDTTRNTISLGIKAFSDFPDQWELLRSDPEKYLGSAVEEIIRWASAVIMFRRTATQDTDLRGQEINRGDRVVMIYASGNRDEEVFDDPWRFDITRKPNEHLGFGGGGPHFCLGTLIARTQLRAMFGEFARSVQRFEAPEIDMVTFNLVHNVRRLPCRLHLDTTARGN